MNKEVIHKSVERGEIERKERREEFETSKNSKLYNIVLEEQIEKMRTKESLIFVYFPTLIIFVK